MLNIKITMLNLVIFEYTIDHKSHLELRSVHKQFSLKLYFDDSFRFKTITHHKSVKPLLRKGLFFTLCATILNNMGLVVCHFDNIAYLTCMNINRNYYFMDSFNLIIIFKSPFTINA